LVLPPFLAVKTKNFHIFSSAAPGLSGQDQDVRGFGVLRLGARHGARHVLTGVLAGILLRWGMISWGNGDL